MILSIQEKFVPLHCQKEKTTTLALRSTVKRNDMKKKKIEIILVSKAFNGYLNDAGMSIHGNGYIHKSILKRELVNAEDGVEQTVEINSICRDVTGSDPTPDQYSWHNGKDSYTVNINGRLWFKVLVDK